MKKYYSLVVLCLLGCAPSREVVQVLKGDRGDDGHSIVSMVVQLDSSGESLEETLVCPNGGNRVDFYVDNDNSLSASEEDLYLNSMITCNGLRGEAGISGSQGQVGPHGEIGPQGIQGIPGQVGPRGEPGEDAEGNSSATLDNYTSSSCTRIGSTSSYVKVSNNTVGLHTSNSCSSNTKFATVAQGESYWVSANALAVWNNNGIRVVTFN